MDYTNNDIDNFNTEVGKLFWITGPVVNGRYQNISPAGRNTKTIMTRESLTGKYVHYLTKSGIPLNELKDVVHQVELTDPRLQIIIYAKSPHIQCEFNMNPSVIAKFRKKSDELKIPIVKNLISLKPKIDNNEILLIPNTNIILDITIDEEKEIVNSKEVLDEETFNNIEMLLQSSDKEIFNIGWKLLWQYDFVKNKNSILLLVKNCNGNTLFLRQKKSNIEYCFKQFRKLWKNY